MEYLMKKLLLVLMLGLSSLTLQGANVDGFSDDFDLDVLLQADELRLAMQAAAEENLFASVAPDVTAAVTKDYRNRGENTFLRCVCCNELIPLKKLNRHVKACKEQFRKFPPLLPTPALPIAASVTVTVTTKAQQPALEQVNSQNLDIFERQAQERRKKMQEDARARHAAAAVKKRKAHDQAGPDKNKKRKF